MQFGGRIVERTKRVRGSVRGSLDAMVIAGSDYSESLRGRVSRVCVF